MANPTIPLPANFSRVPDPARHSEAPLYGPATLSSLRSSVVGRDRELELVVAALMAGRHLLLEGPPGTGKSTILRAIARTTAQGFQFVEGNAELTPARLAGHFDPARVLDSGYVDDIWIDGPLLAALRDGGLLYIEELNRIPEDTLNVLVTVMSEGELTIPRLGTVSAHPNFRLIAAMNPFDAVGTARVAGAIYDRVCRIAMTYQSVAEETDIALAGAQASSHDELAALAPALVEVVRATRSHPDVAVGASVRGAIDSLLLIDQLALLRSVSLNNNGVGLDAALLALSGRLRMDDASTRTSEEIITELWQQVMHRRQDGDVPESNDPDTSNPDSQSGSGADPGKEAGRQEAAPTTTGS